MATVSARQLAVFVHSLAESVAVHLLELPVYT